jgi:hypothetical protein
MQSEFGEGYRSKIPTVQKVTAGANPLPVEVYI